VNGKDRLLNVVLHLADEIAFDREIVRHVSNQALAEKYAVSPRTVTNWRKAGCPFDDGQWRVLDWMADQRSVPARARQKFARQLERRRETQVSNEWQALLRHEIEMAKQLRGIR
jgi:hypothetical protein